MTESRNTKLIVRSMVNYWTFPSEATGELEPRYTYAQVKSMLKGSFAFTHAGERYVVACFDRDEKDAAVRAYDGQFIILLKGKEILLVTARDNLLSMHTWIDDWLMGDRALLHAVREAMLEHWPLPEEFMLELEAKAAEHASHWHASQLFILRTMSALELKTLHGAGLDTWPGYTEALASVEAQSSTGDNSVKLLRALRERGLEAWEPYEATVAPLRAYHSYLYSAHRPERAQSYEVWCLDPQTQASC